jgi:hypothetical protein
MGEHLSPPDPLEEVNLIRSGRSCLIDSGDQARLSAAGSISLDESLITRSRQAIAGSRHHLANTRPSPAKDEEFAHLKLADAHIGSARIRIHRQRNLIRYLSRKGMPIELAQRILETMQSTLREMEGHRALMHDRLGVKPAG